MPDLRVRVDEWVLPSHTQAARVAEGSLDLAICWVQNSDLETLSLKALTPFGDGVGVAAQFLSDMIIAWDAWSDSTAENDACSKSECLRGRKSVGQFAQLLFFCGREPDGGCFTSHEGRSLSTIRRGSRAGTKDRKRAENGQLPLCTQRFRLTRPVCETQD